MSGKKYYSKCCYPVQHVCEGALQWHHNLIYRGEQSNIPETILPICEGIHEKARTKEVKDILDMVMLNRMTDEQIKSISKAVDYFHKKKYLNDLYVRKVRSVRGSPGET